MMQINEQEIRAALTARGQSHILDRAASLNDAERDKLFAQAAKLNLGLLDQLGKGAEEGRGSFAPLGAVTVGEIDRRRDEFRANGLDAIRAGKVGAVLLAGGQGTRLGHDGPKGTVNVGVTRELYIFECLINNLTKVTEAAGCSVPLYIMTSEKNDAETRAFFEQHSYFGYDKDYIRFFIQEMAPAVDYNGKLLMEDACTISTSPNGNGGWFSSMVSAGLLPELKSRGVEWLNVFAVDNVLQQIADPCFVGATILSGCQAGAKVVAKADPDERVGVLCLEDGRPSIVEYYEMTEEMRTRREADGTLSYNYGVILNYLFSLSRLEEIVNTELPVHVVEKKIPYMTESGEFVKPDQPNGYKFETLVLDMVHLQESCLSYEVVRDEEFAPIKNPTGVDSLVSARALLEKNGIVL